MPAPGIHALQGGPHHILGWTKHPQSCCRHPHERQTTACGFSERLDGGAEGITCDPSNLDLRTENAIAVMQRRNRLPTTATDRDRLVAARDTRILMELHHTNGDRVGRFCHSGTDRTLDAVDDGGEHNVIGIMLNGVVAGDWCQLSGCHAPVESETDNDRAAVGQSLVQRS